jgi:hypothetical protein
VRRALTLLLAGAIAGTALVAVAPAGAADSSRLTLVVRSGRPMMVSGGDVLVGVRGAAADATPRFTVGGRAVQAQRVGRDWLVSGLRDGRNVVAARVGNRRATVAVVNHPISGPIFSGPHLPLLCTVPTVAPTAAADATCETERTVEYRYRSTTSNRFEPLPNAPADGDEAAVTAPPDAARITVDDREVPYVVRVERGTINRSPYSFASVVDGWNQRYVHQFGGGCGTAYSQGSPLGTDVLDDGLLSRGYAVATANFNTFQTSCNPTLSAETAMMVKERVTEVLGPPRFTIGSGASGGAIQQLLIAQNYPGILDALSPVVPFPDAISIAPGVSDCGLLQRFYASEQGRSFTEAQQIAVNGHRTTGTCRLWVSSFLNTIDPTVGCDSRIPEAEIYSPTNSEGIRCTLQDLNRNIFGIDPRTGFARRPLDNVGVQYGLEALRAGTITVDQFLDLNEHIGGFDINGQIVAQRERARARDVRRAYATGQVLSGGGTIRDIPIIMVNLYSDPFGDIHDRFRLFTIRERLARDGRRDPNLTIWTRGSNGDLAQALTGTAFDPAALIETLDTWLTTGERPDEAVDNCTDEQGKVVSGRRIYDEPGPCRDLYPPFGDPRTAAGAPLINDVVKCQRVPVRPGSYGVELSPEQVERLRRIFPNGVCSWKARGVGQVPMAATWIDYSRGPFAVVPSSTR